MERANCGVERGSITDNTVLQYTMGRYLLFLVFRSSNIFHMCIENMIYSSVKLCSTQFYARNSNLYLSMASSLSSSLVVSEVTSFGTWAGGEAHSFNFDSTYQSKTSLSR